MSATVDAVIFDLGGVVLRWEPERAYGAVLPADQVAAFMTKIDFPTWNRSHDAGRLFAEGEADLAARFPDDGPAIAAYREHFALTLTGLVPGTSAVIAELQRAGVRLVALTNWSAETFPVARERFGILKRFEGIVVSGTELLAKPDPAIFRLACSRHGLDPHRTLFVDDSVPNVHAARAAGLDAVHFHDSGRLRAELADRGLLGEPDVIDQPVWHLAVATDWARARAGGDYPWSTRDISYEHEGYVHCSFTEQVETVRRGYYADLGDEELVVLRLAADAGPLVVEDLGSGQGFPHLYTALIPGLVASEHPPAGLPAD